MYTLDTNILIYHANGSDAKVSAFLLAGLGHVLFFLPTIAVVEFCTFPRMTMEAQHLFEEIVPSLTIVPLDYDTAIIAGELRGRYKLSLGDSIVAATAISQNSILVTRNTRDFKNVPSLQIESL